MNPSDLKRLAKEAGVPIEALSARKMIEIRDAIQAQNRTSNHKKTVKIVDDLVFKGPYTCNDTALMNNLRYTYAVELLEDALKLPEWRRGSLPWVYIGCGGVNQYYLVAPNVGKWRNIPSDLVTTKIDKNVPVVPRGEAVWRVLEIEKNGRLTDDVKSAALQHLYCRFLLGIGDSGTHNVLLREDCDSTGRLIAGIDLEERRAIKANEQRLAHLFTRAPSKKQVFLYESDTYKIKSLSYSQLEQHTLGRLGAVGIDLERLKENMDLWEKLK